MSDNELTGTIPNAITGLKNLGTHNTDVVNILHCWLFFLST